MIDYRKMVQLLIDETQKRVNNEFKRNNNRFAVAVFNTIDFSLTVKSFKELAEAKAFYFQVEDVNHFVRIFERIAHCSYEIG